MARAPNIIYVPVGIVGATIVGIVVGIIVGIVVGIIVGIVVGVLLYVGLSICVAKSKPSPAIPQFSLRSLATWTGIGIGASIPISGGIIAIAVPQKPALPPVPPTSGSVQALSRPRTPPSATTSASHRDPPTGAGRIVSTDQRKCTYEVSIECPNYTPTSKEGAEIPICASDLNAETGTMQIRTPAGRFSPSTLAVKVVDVDETCDKQGIITNVVAGFREKPGLDLIAAINLNKTARTNLSTRAYYCVAAHRSLPNGEVVAYSNKIAVDRTCTP